MQTVLIFSSEATTSRPVASLLSNCGYRVIEAATEADAHRGCETHAVDLVLLGAQTDDCDLAGRLRDFHPKTKVAFMSGYDNLSVVSKGHQIVQEDLWAELEMIALPVGPTALIRRVRNLLNEGRPVVPAATVAADCRQQDTCWV